MFLRLRTWSPCFFVLFAGRPASIGGGGGDFPHHQLQRQQVDRAAAAEAMMRNALVIMGRDATRRYLFTITINKRILFLLLHRSKGNFVKHFYAV